MNVALSHHVFFQIKVRCDDRIVKKQPDFKVGRGYGPAYGTMWRAIPLVIAS
jgi:hypothetical protein